MLVAISTFRWWGLLLVPYNLALWFSVVYLSQHWFVDVLAGIVWATAIWILVTWLFARRPWQRTIDYASPITEPQVFAGRDPNSPA
jgi:membrane-associated phospholipid phosphatase